MTRLAPKPPSRSAAKIKRIARGLFAERGVDGVSVREIAEAAGQKNHAAVAYYFGSKEALVREIILDGAAAIDEKRNAMLDAVEAEGRPLELIDIVRVLIYSSVDFGPPDEVASYNRFIVLVDMTHREFFLETLEGRGDKGYLRCFEHLRRLMPDMGGLDLSPLIVLLGVQLLKILFQLH